MTKQEALEKIEELKKYVEQQDLNQENEKEEKFLELFQVLTMKSDIEKYPGSVFYFRDDDLMLEMENDNLWVSYNRIWFIFEEDFGMKYTGIQDFIKRKVEKHFNWNGLTPRVDFGTRSGRVEKHFKNS